MLIYYCRKVEVLNHLLFILMLLRGNVQTGLVVMNYWHVSVTSKINEIPLSLSSE